MPGTPSHSEYNDGMAGSALNFEAGHTQIHQVLATRSDGGESAMSLRPKFE